MKNLILMLDFDGTLCPLTCTPDKAKISAKMKNVLRKCAQKMPVAIISGRSLKDIKEKIGLKGLVYAGNHGLEWEIDGKKGRAVSMKHVVSKLKTAKRKIIFFLKKYPGSFLEDKGIILALHYRNVSKGKEKAFKKEAIYFLKKLSSSGRFSLSEGKKVFELKPTVKWNKGTFAVKIFKFYQKKLRKKLLPICIGDDQTDEDIFKRFKFAITVHVGRNKLSRANYFLRSHEQVCTFLENIVNAFNT